MLILGCFFWYECLVASQLKDFNVTEEVVS